MNNKENIQTNVVKPRLSFNENKLEHVILDKKYEVALDKSEATILKYMSENEGFGKTSDEKDELYKQAQILWGDYATELRNAKYVFYLNRQQYNFLTDTITKKMEYDVNTVFLAIELTNTMGNMKLKSNFPDDKVLEGFEVDATEITYIYHLISKYKVKGLDKSAYNFGNVLKRIGDISKIVNYYDNTGKTLSGDIQDWVAKFEPNVTKDTDAKVEQA
jgi:hypothetical protein